MKCRVVYLTLDSVSARSAASKRLCNPDDTGVTTHEEAELYQGPTFEENGSDCIDLHIVYRDGLCCVNFINEDGVRINYDYPICTLKRIKHEANEFLN